MSRTVDPPDANFDDLPRKEPTAPSATVRSRVASADRQSDPDSPAAHIPVCPSDAQKLAPKRDHRTALTHRRASAASQQSRQGCGVDRCFCVAFAAQGPYIYLFGCVGACVRRRQWRGGGPGPGLDWAGPSARAMPFRIGDVAYDSSDAFAIAAEVQITLGHSGRYPAPVWYVL